MARRSHPRSLALALLVASLALVGCGTSGGDDAGDDPTTTAAADPTTATTADPGEDPTETSDPGEDPTETTDPREDPTETTEPAGDADICEPLQVLSDYDADSAEVIAGGDWDAIQQFFIDGTEPVLEAYDEAIEVDVDPEVTADLEELRAITEGTSELAAESTDLMDLSGKLLALPGIESAGSAGLRLNTYAEATCGFSTGGASN